ncbi:MAG: penicillin-binding protein 1C [Roseovarius sp.]|nr:penicillin-binding protein 1C [Roseovarius sp.]
MRRADGWLLSLALLLFLAGLARDGADLWIARTELPPLLSETSVEVLDRHGETLRIHTVADGRWRLGVDPRQVDPRYLDMLIAYEDQRFYTHGGIDPLALLRAAGQALWHGRIVSGGSTLTMQVARLLENSGTGRWRGKFRQMRVALALERRLSKRQILALYLTRAPFGGNLEGVRAATRAWYGKEPRRLTAAEAALLVALPQSPETRRPDRDAPAARAARDRVLARLAAQGVMTHETYRAALTDPVPTERRGFPMLAAHLADRATGQRPGVTRHHLTIDGDLQRALERLARRSARRLPPGVSVAIQIADHRNGEILASVGSAGYAARPARYGFVDMTRAPRSPGSTLKPLVYAMAFDRGLAHPQTLIPDRPVTFGDYSPENFDGAFRGELPVAEALRLSLNIPVVLLMNEIGPGHLMDVMRRAGARPELPGDRAGLAVALGGVGVTLSDMVQTYAMLANGGQARPLRWRQGATTAPAVQVLGRTAAWQVADILSGVAPPAGAPTWRLAHKTGTSYGHRDTWAVGFDRRHVAGVWVGRPDGTPVPGAFGGEIAAPLLFEAFQRLKDRAEPLPPPPPDSLIVPTAELPQPLRRFTGRGSVFSTSPDAPKLVFPPDGARLPITDERLTVKLRDGVPPFTFMANGRPLRTGIHQREASLPVDSKGFSTISVIDAKGRAARVSIRID